MESSTISSPKLNQQNQNRTLIKFMIDQIENGRMPDFITRIGIRSLLNARLKETEEKSKSLGGDANYLQQYARDLRMSDIAIMTKEANEQHYEVPTGYYDLVLGPKKKYSSCYYLNSKTNLNDAEQVSLDLTIEHAGLIDGMTILELGCGWGSLSLEMAKRFPNSKIISVSNSKTQKQYIDSRAKERGLTNLEIRTKNLGIESEYDFEENTFDRIVTVEMMEHVRNYDRFFKLISKTLKADGKMFIHIFTTNSLPYVFETEGDDNWMGKYFFSGGQMPSVNLFDSFNDVLKVEQKWSWNGRHYQKTLEDWLVLHDKHKNEIITLFESTYGKENAHLWFYRWRIFYLACSELFGYKKGYQWGVTHYLLTK